jgi:hypothetical protein
VKILSLFTVKLSYRRQTIKEVHQILSMAATSLTLETRKKFLFVVPKLMPKYFDLE